jgi:hypothetical protein
MHIHNGYLLKCCKMEVIMSFLMSFRIILCLNSNTFILFYFILLKGIHIYDYMLNLITYDHDLI